jgi:VWFA-related protein
MQPSLFLVLSALVLPSPGGTGLAQQPVQPQPQLAVKAPAPDVMLPVTVIDKHGALVTNLTEKDFTLTEDGRPQTIKSLTTQSNLPFRLGLLAQTTRSHLPAMESERKAAGKFVDLMLPADPKAGDRDDQIFLLHFDREVELLEDFTGSREKLHHELDEMGTTALGRNNPRGPETSSDEREYGQRPGGRATEPQLYDAIYLASNELMKPAPGRKALVVFSDGVDHGSKETLNDAIDAADRAGVEIFTIYLKGEEERAAGGVPNGRQRGGMGGNYPGGGWPGGGGNPGGSSSKDSQSDGKKILEKISSRTGGQYFDAKKRENLDEIYLLIANALRQQYWLTYTPGKADDEGEFHKIVLKTGKSDLTVVTREGYYAPSGK